MTTARDALRTSSIIKIRTLENNLNFLNNQNTYIMTCDSKVNQFNLLLPHLPTVWMLPSGLLLVSHSVDTEVLFSEIKNQMTVTATNNYDYVNETCSPSFNRKENGKKTANKISQYRDSPKLQWKAHIKKQTCTWLNFHLVTGFHTSSYPIWLNVMYLYFF
jgi:hypothetical protein